MNAFITLSNAEKLEEMAKANFWRGEIPYAEEYMLALRDGNQTVIDEYESFGDELRHIMRNKAQYVQGFTVYGFTEKCFNKYGWMMDVDFLDCEEIVFDANGRFRGTNSIELGRGPNGKWTHGMWLSASKSGQTSGLSVYGHSFASRNACLKDALEYFIQWHEKENDKKTAPALREAKNMLDTLTGRRTVQMSLFG